MRKLLIPVAVALAAVTATPTAAQARPVDPLEEVVRPGDIGPGERDDWWCTYQRKHEGISCVYIPGVHRPMPVHTREEANVWWNPWSWFA